MTDDIRPPGAFCWFDLKTRDVPGTAVFLSGALGWETAEPAGLRAALVLTRDGYPVGSLSDLANPIYRPDLPEHVAWYVAVDDVEARIAAAELAGAAIVLAPFEVPGQGRMATLVDPFGAAISLWEPTGFSGWTFPRGTLGAPFAPAHAGPEPGDAAAFYRTAGLSDDDVVFERAAGPAEWRLRVHGPDLPVTTPGEITIYPAERVL
ncbi:glyoxalase [Amycolatopsis thailandensis]|uniref:Glyoxalase n=1 Tax=Amycolatopsis thailandensis TaxID=589330 RepID=A0A229RIR7_9PSEU|nr:hypothetical protein [Amycolatopsis thailandensis]OXM46533.1 glyoxalase [Amycolatopsis thailandensis]